WFRDASGTKPSRWAGSERVKSRSTPPGFARASVSAGRATSPCDVAPVAPVLEPPVDAAPVPVPPPVLALPVAPPPVPVLAAGAPSSSLPQAARKTAAAAEAPAPASIRRRPTRPLSTLAQ